MAVEISDILHVLAHELRTPVGIAHGYVRMLLEDRLPQEAERRRALEQTQKALARLTHLSQESSTLAAWYEREDTNGSVAARSLLTRLQDCEYDSPVTIDAGHVPESATLQTPNEKALADALADLVRATARESGASACLVSARADERRRLEVLIGPPDLLAALAGGPHAPGAGPIALERGGLGLALVQAAVILDAHGAERWTMNGARQTVGVLLPLTA